MASSFSFDMSLGEFVKSTPAGPNLDHRKAVEAIEKTRKTRHLVAMLDCQNSSMQERFKAYIALAGRSRQSYEPGMEIPNLTKLGEYTNRHRSSIASMAEAKKVDLEVYHLLLCLAAIYPPPKPDECPGYCRRRRLAVADQHGGGKWDEGMLDLLHLDLEDPEQLRLVVPEHVAS